MDKLKMTRLNYGHPSVKKPRVEARGHEGSRLGSTNPCTLSILFPFPFPFPIPFLLLKQEQEFLLVGSSCFSHGRYGMKKRDDERIRAIDDEGRSKYGPSMVDGKIG